MLSNKINNSVAFCLALLVWTFSPNDSHSAQSPYCVVDLGETEDTTSYSVSFLDQLPDDFASNSNAYKSAKIVLKWIEPKPFRMGASGIALPARNVTLSEGFYLGVYEITQAQWQRVMNNSPFHFTNQPHAPAEKVSWNDIRGPQAKSNWPLMTSVTEESFLGRLNGRTDGQHVFELPTEAQWEYACRAGTTNQWSYGDSEDEADDHSWQEANSSKRTHEVGLLKPNPFGLYDMHGNVWEWCLDRYDRYPHADETDPTGPTTGWYRIWRGGCFGVADYLTRSAHRSGGTPDSRAIHAGFRLALLIGR